MSVNYTVNIAVINMGLQDMVTTVQQIIHQAEVCWSTLINDRLKLLLEEDSEYMQIHTELV